MLNKLAVFTGFLYYVENSFFIYGFDGFGRNLQSYPTIFFRNVKFLFLNVGAKPPFGLGI